MFCFRVKYILYIVCSLVFLTQGIHNTNFVEAQIPDSSFSSQSSLLISRGLDFQTATGARVLPAVLECTSSLQDESRLVQNVLDAQQVCRDRRSPDQLFFNCGVRPNTNVYRCENTVNTSEITSAPEGDSLDRQESSTGDTLIWTAQNFMYDRRIFQGECASTSQNQNLASCRREDSGNLQYYLCTELTDPTVITRFRCNRSVGTFGEDITTIDDLNVDNEDILDTLDQSFTGDNTDVRNTTDLTLGRADEKPVAYESFTNFPGLGRISNLCQLMEALWFLGFTVLFLGVIGSVLYGGFLYTSAGVNAAQVNQAKGIIQNAFIGLGLGLSIFVILQTIDPNLLSGNCEIPAIDRFTNQE